MLYKYENDVLEEYEVKINFELLKKIRLQIIENCSFIKQRTINSYSGWFIKDESIRNVELVKECAKELNMNIQEGVYAFFSGPTYETPAEVRMAQILGADAVGMSTAPEVIVASHSKMEVVGISCITNMAAGILDQPLDHEEVIETTQKVKSEFLTLVKKVVNRI